MSEKSFRLRSAISLTLVSASLSIAMASCNKHPPTTRDTEVTPGPRAPLSLTGYTVHRVRLPYTHHVRGEKGERQAFNDAWMILLSLRNLGPPRAPATYFYIGEYKVPEYGGALDGIYFRVYDEARLRSLDGQEISVQEPGAKRRTLDRKFILPELSNLPVEEEDLVLGLKK